MGLPVRAAPTVAGNTMLVGTEAGKVFGLEASTGDVLWDIQAGHERITDSPIVAWDTMFAVSANGALYAITGDK